MSTGFLSQYGGEIGTLTLEHVWLTAWAMLIAAAIAIPAGVWLTRSPRWAKPVIAVANILQTIPSLAMFGFLLPLPWLGERAARIAIVALTAYALLPIVRNTYAGICGSCPRTWPHRPAAALQGGAAPGGVLHLCRAANGDGDLRRHCDDCGGSGRGRFRRVDLSRRGLGG
jgi:osmoprotectant transport system permease protein